MSEHTPGPWQVLPEECDKPYIRIRGTVLGCRYKIANVLTPHYEGVHEREAAETRANARLIAAAPELLEALKPFAELLKKHHDSMSDDRPIFAIEDSIITAGDLRKAVAAIAKAEGMQ